MHYFDIKHCNMVNGCGLRTVIWVAGCERKCPGCFSPHTHDFKGGIEFDEDAKKELMCDLNEDWCAGVTWLGGEPLHPVNLPEVLKTAKEIREKFPSKTQWLYTGYCWDEIIRDDKMSEILKYVDVVCDGPFVESLKDVTLEWVGSSNQNVIDVKERLMTQKTA
jgi:anaerobic ribonucleoside-triphosphate reductase activating protein